jgi:hypothetical protein
MAATSGRLGHPGCDRESLSEKYDRDNCEKNAQFPRHYKTFIRYYTTNKTKGQKGHCDNFLLFSSYDPHKSRIHISQP